MNIEPRYELKFVLDNAQLSDAMRWMFSHTHAREKHIKRKVNSLYFDDANFTSVRDNLAGVSNRQKTRLRWYGFEDISPPVFEIKVRDGRLGYKKNYQLNSLRENLLVLDNKDIVSECENELRKQQVIFDEPFSSILQVSFDREYYEDLDGVRITIDQNIKFYGSLPHQKLNNTLSMAYPYKIMEIKFAPHLKARIAQLIKPMHIIPKRHSKYLVGMAMLGYTVYI